MTSIGNIQVDTCGNAIEVTVFAGEHAGLSVIVSPEMFAALVVRAEQLEPMMAFRRREAREMASTQARASRR